MAYVGPVSGLILVAVAFALGTDHVSSIMAAVVIAVVSIGMTLVGLELGNRLGASVER